MSKELACAKCGKTGGLGEEVTIETTGWRPCEVYAKPGGGVKVERGPVEDGMSSGFRDVSDTGDIGCSECDATFATWEEATADEVVEYRCAKCGWWGLQDWLHVDCDGELTEHKIPHLGVSA